MQSSFFNDQKVHAISFISNLYKTNQLGSLSDKYLVDIGPGDGTFLIDLLTQLPLNNYKILLIEPSERMLKITSEKLEKNFQNRVKISTINKEIQDVLPEDIKLATNGVQNEVGLTIASLSIHHMINRSKLKVLEFLHSFTPRIIICEITGNHEAPENSPKLLLSCLHLYEELISGVMEINDISLDQKWLAIEDFLLSEALRIIGNSYETRVDYHIKKEEWINFAETAGFKLISERNTYLDKAETPLAYALAFKNLEI
jgi:SAM-dependent methyltransferase